MSDLDRLIEAVEAGVANGPLFEAAWPASYHAEMAYNGSLDAAKALHEALLGDGYISNGWLYSIYGSGKASVWEIISGKSFAADVPQPALHAVSPARAWLLAVLKAYRSAQ